MSWLAGEMLAEIGPRMGIRVTLEPTYRYVGQLVAPDGRKFYFRNTNFDLNGQGAGEIARDKAYAAFFLRQMGYPVPEGETFYSDSWCRVIGSDRNIHAAYRYARSLGYPVVVKPNGKSHGAGVARVHNRREFYRAMRAVFNRVGDRVALVQRAVEGDDYRLVVLDEEVVVAYQRQPPSVVGDGRTTIGQLLAAKLADLAKARRETSLGMDDYLIHMRLRRERLGLQSVPPRGQRIFLRDSANLSCGGDAVDVTENIHDGFRLLAGRLARELALRYCGVDLLLTGSIAEPPSGYVVLEVNPAPGLDHFARCGEPQRRRVEAMYERILRALTGG